MSARPDFKRATIARSSNGALALAVEQMPLGERPDLAAAVQALCEHAVATGTHLVVEVSSRSGRQHMTIDPAGLVAHSAAPAPTAEEVRAARAKPDLGSSPREEAESAAWVQRYILDPSASRPAPIALPSTPSRRRLPRLALHVLRRG